MGEESKVADYFVVAGLPSEPVPLANSIDTPNLKASLSLDPITDITVIFPSEGEKCPRDYCFLDKTPFKGSADLNCGSLNSPEVFICYRRGRDKPPLVDIGVLFEHKERVLEDSKIVFKTPYDRIANVNNTAARTFLTYRRAPPDMPANELVVTDICVINETKLERPPHAYCMIKKNLNKGMWGNAMYLCYKKSVHRANLISYKVGVLSRYPAHDHPDLPLPLGVEMFCMPMGASLEVWPPEASQPNLLFSTFVLTVDGIGKVYGAAVTFYERYPIDKLTDEQLACLESEKSGCVTSGSASVNANKSICIISRWPFFDCFERFLRFLYSMSCQGPHSVPIERYISHLLEDVPFPSPQRPRILIQLSAEERLILAQPEDVPLPRSGAGFLDLLENLSVEDTLLVLLLVITEQKILVHSLRANVLTAVVEAISMIVFPFKWQCAYIPLCPLALAEYLHAPLPVLIGVDSRFFDLYDPPADVTCVDLDTNNITTPEDKRHLTTKMLPKRSVRILRTALENLCVKCIELKRTLYPSDQNDETSDFQAQKKEQRLQLEIQVAFLRFMASILKGYRGFLLPITKQPTAGATDMKSLFDIQGFLKTRDKAYHKFYHYVTGTQMFNRFIEERSFVSDMDAGLAFFDECIEKVEVDDSNCRLLEIEDSHKSERTVFIAPPEPTGLPEGESYSYNGFELNSSLLKEVDKGNRLQVPSNTITPGSPMARRTKHEVKSARKLARYNHHLAGRHWAKYVLSTCYSVWFIHLPSYVAMDPDKASSCLKAAYDILGKLQKAKLHLTDEVCYRVMMQLCGIHGQPGTAVKLLLQMKKNGIQPNALTYGYYNRAVLEAKWPQEHGPSRLLWNKLRNVTMAVSYLSKMKEKGDLDGAAGASGSRDKLPAGSNCSLTSIDPHSAGPQFAQFDKHCSRVGSIVKPAPKMVRDLALQQSVESAAGILITSQKKHSSAFELRYSARRNSCTEFSTQQPPPARTDVRLRRGSMSPIQAETLSFANDNLILEKHNRLKKFFDGSQTTPIKGLSSTPESHELDLDASQDNLKDKQKIPRGRLVSRLTDLWRGSEDSVASDLSGQDETPVKRKPNGKPPWSSSEVLAGGGRNTNDRFRFEQRAASESLEDNRKIGQDRGDYFTARSQRSGSEEVWSNSINSSITDVSNLDNLKDDDSERAINGSERSGSEVSDRLPSGMVSPVRTPVTENDPLGALHTDEDDNQLTITNLVDANNLLNKKHLLEMSTSTPQKTPPTNDTGDGRKRSRIESYFENGMDVLFGASFADREAKEKNQKAAQEEVHKKNMQRSSTLPNTVSESPMLVSSPSLGLNLNLSSPFKFPFSRMSPSRMSLKKAELKICKTLESAMSGSKKNEIIQAGLSTVKSVKSAATIVAKKLEEVISTNTTPVKSISQSQEVVYDDHEAVNEKNSTLDFEGWGNFKELFGDSSRSSRKSSTATPALDDCVADEVVRDTLYGSRRLACRCMALNLILTTCSRCTSCTALLHDEEIIAGWTSDDSNLNTKCHFCGKPTLPVLTVTIHDYRGKDKSSVSGSDMSLSKGLDSSSQQIPDLCRPADEPFVLDPISVPYLNPLVLRKELENILQHKGDPSLMQASFVDQHPIIFWNMVWWFDRIMVPSHLPGLLLSSQTLDKKQTVHESWLGITDYTCVSVVCLWDNPRLHDEVGQPMYMLWQQKEQQSSLVSALVTDRNAVSKRDIEKIIAHLKMDNLKDPMLLLVKERAKQAKKGVVQRRSLYRDILYLALVEFGRNFLDIETFEREYNVEYQKMISDGVTLHKCDKPPVSASFRNYFRPLLLLQEFLNKMLSEVNSPSKNK